MHIFDLNPDIAAISANIARLVALGVQVHITEADVALSVDGNRNPKDPEDLNRQAEICRSIVRACLDQPGCTAIQTWGFTDKYSWIFGSSGRTKDAAVLFDQNYQPKPAYLAVRDALARGRNPVP
jgi:endo-1,4-beta-xylanase